MFDVVLTSSLSSQFMIFRYFDSRLGLRFPPLVDLALLSCYPTDDVTFDHLSVVIVWEMLIIIGFLVKSSVGYVASSSAPSTAPPARSSVYWRSRCSALFDPPVRRVPAVRGLWPSRCSGPLDVLARGCHQSECLSSSRRFPRC